MEPLAVNGLKTGRKKISPLAMAYFPVPLQAEYRQRWGVSLPCSGWERVVPPRSNHQRAGYRIATLSERRNTESAEEPTETP